MKICESLYKDYLSGRNNRNIGQYLVRSFYPLNPMNEIHNIVSNPALNPDISESLLVIYEFETIQKYIKFLQIFCDSNYSNGRI